MLSIHDLTPIEPVRFGKTTGNPAPRADISGFRERLAEWKANRPGPEEFAILQEYATVQVNGRIVARIDNGGGVASSNSDGWMITSALRDSDTSAGRSGPMLAQQRAEILARSLGGKVVKSSTALTQAQYDAAPRPESPPSIREFLKGLGAETLQTTVTAQTMFNVQQLGQSE